MKIPGSPEMTSGEQKSSGLIYKIIKIFTVINPGEGPTVILLALNILLIACAYSILKPVRKGLILTKYKAEQEAYLYAVVAVLLIFVVKIFSYLSSKVPRQILIASVTLFFISNLVLFYFLNLSGTPMRILGVIFYIWLGIFNVFIIAQFWGFANDIYTEQAGKRLFALIMLGQNLGAFIGAESTKRLVKPEGPLSIFQLMILAGVLLGISIVLTIITHKKEIKRFEKKEINRQETEELIRRAGEKPLERGGGFRLVFKSRYLIFVAFVILVLNYVNTTGEYIKSKVWQSTVKEATAAGKIEASEEATSQYYTKIEADFTSTVNLLTFLIQLFLVSRIFKWFGVRGALLFLPFISLGGYSSIALLGASFAAVRWTKILENSTDYSLMNTTRGALYLITSREEKYKSKAAIDTFFVRIGDVLHSLTVFVGTTYLALTIDKFAKINVFMAVIWIILCFFAIREHKKLSAERMEYQLA